jgi:hypothetical protein
MVMTASPPCGAVDDGGELLELEDEGVPRCDMELEVDEVPASILGEPQAERPRARTGTTARRLILRVMRYLQIRRPSPQPQPGVRRDDSRGLVVEIGFFETTVFV